MYNKNFLFISLIILVGFWNRAALAEQLIRYPMGSSVGDFRYSYPALVLQLTLDKTAHKFGPARVVNAKLSMNTARILIELEKGQLLDVVSSGASRDLEKRFLPVSIGIRKGILGIRLLLINKKHQPMFSAIRNLEELKKIRAGQGFDWIDTQILKNNGFNVVTGTNYKGLFAMLKSSRFDYFPRGVYEAFPEVEQHSLENPDLSVERSLAIYYSYPDFFWVNKNNTALAERLYEGMEKSIADGSLNRLFENEYGKILQKAELHKRRVFIIPNTEIDYIPYEGNPNYWFIEQIMNKRKSNLAQ